MEATRLGCIECGAESDEHARGWQAHIADDPRDDDPLQVAVYCSECAQRESG